MSRIQPHSDEAEAAVIGAAMKYASVLDEVIPIIDGPESFYHGRHQKLWRAIVAVHARGITPDESSVYQELQRAGDAGSNAGQVPIVYLTDLTEPLITTANARHNAAKVREHATRRAAIRVHEESIAAAYDLAADTFATIEAAQDSLAALALRPSGTSSYHYSTMFADVIAEIERRSETATGLAGMPCGLADLDAILSGFQRKDNVVLAARPAMGKTGIALEIGEGLAANGHPGLIISLEMSALSLGMRSVARHARVDATRIRGGKIGRDDWTDMHAAVARLSKLGIAIEDGSSLSIGQMASLVKRYKRTHGIEWVALDYLQLSNAPGAKSRELEISAISRGGKQIAKDNDVCWIALSQLNRALESRGDKRPMLSDLRESGSIEADADVVMFLHRPEYYGIPQDADGNSTEGLAEVIIGKQRNGAIGTVKLTFRPEWIAFENYTPRDDAPTYLPTANGPTPDERFGSARGWRPPDDDSQPF